MITETIEQKDATIRRQQKLIDALTQLNKDMEGVLKIKDEQLLKIAVIDNYYVTGEMIKDVFELVTDRHYDLNEVKVPYTLQSKNVELPPVTVEFVFKHTSSGWSLVSPTLHVTSHV